MTYLEQMINRTVRPSSRRRNNDTIVDTYSRPVRCQRCVPTLCINVPTLRINAYTLGINVHTMGTYNGYIHILGINVPTLGICLQWVHTYIRYQYTYINQYTYIRYQYTFIGYQWKKCVWIMLNHNKLAGENSLATLTWYYLWPIALPNFGSLRP